MSTILIVEDNDKNMKLARDLLRHAGHQTLEATTGEEGVRLAITHHPDLVLMDIQLPGIDGIETLRRIRADAALRDVPVLSVSASVMPEQRQHIEASGFDAHLSKPLSIRPFLAAVERALARGKQR